MDNLRIWYPFGDANLLRDSKTHGTKRNGDVSKTKNETQYYYFLTNIRSSSIVISVIYVKQSVGVFCFLTISKVKFDCWKLFENHCL